MVQKGGHRSLINHNQRVVCSKRDPNRACVIEGKSDPLRPHWGVANVTAVYNTIGSNAT